MALCRNLWDAADIFMREFIVALTFVILLVCLRRMGLKLVDRQMYFTNTEILGVQKVPAKNGKAPNILRKFEHNLSISFFLVQLIN